RHTRFSRDWSSDVCSSDLLGLLLAAAEGLEDALAQLAADLQGVEELLELLADPRALAQLGGLGLDGHVAHQLGEPAVHQHLGDRSEERRVGKQSGAGWCTR